jgi:hypothetical protein
MPENLTVQFPFTDTAGLSCPLLLHELQRHNSEPKPIIQSIIGLHSPVNHWASLPVTVTMHGPAGLHPEKIAHYWSTQLLCHVLLTRSHHE